jgi:ABC-type Fe2+-enterobactin transport system substrate-binding protein
MTHEVDTVAPIHAWPRLALVDILFTVFACEAFWAITAVVGSNVGARCAILARVVTTFVQLCGCLAVVASPVVSAGAHEKAVL